MCVAVQTSVTNVECSLELGRSTVFIEVGVNGRTWQGRAFSYLEICKDSIIYYWVDESFRSVSRYSNLLITLVCARSKQDVFENSVNEQNV